MSANIEGSHRRLAPIPQGYPDPGRAIFGGYFGGGRIVAAAKDAVEIGEIAKPNIKGYGKWTHLDCGAY
jgi:hypothetical protein